MANNVCSECGGRIVGLNYSSGGKNYCQTCFDKLTAALSSQETEKQELLKYIREVFQVADVPADVISSISREIRRGKTTKGIRSTIKYYYFIEGNPTTNIANLPYVIQDQYEAARAYAQRMKEIKEKNKDIDLTTESVNIKINPRDLNRKRKKIAYNIEDL